MNIGVKLELYGKYNEQLSRGEEIHFKDMNTMERCCFIVSFHTCIVKGRKDRVYPHATYEWLSLLLSRDDQLPAYALILLLDSVRLLKKRLVLDGALFRDFVTKTVGREYPFIHQLKILSGILRIIDDDPRVEDDPILRHIEHILEHFSVQRFLSELVSPREIERRREDGLGLVSLSPKPSIRIFLMRLAIHVLKQCQDQKVSEETMLNLWQKIPWAPWQFTLGLMALFNDHEGLIYKMLLSVLILEEHHSEVFIEAHPHFCSLLLYRDFSYRSDYSVDYLINSLGGDVGNLVIEYLYRLWKLAAEGLLYCPETLELPEMVKLHRELLPRLAKYNHLRPLHSRLSSLCEIRVDESSSRDDQLQG